MLGITMRRIALCCSLSVAFLIAWRVSVTPLSAASTITVTTTSDTIDSADGLCSLREAIIAANTDSGGGGCLAGSGADTIAFGAGLPYPTRIVLARAGADENAALTGDLDVSGTLTIIGPGAQSLAIDANHLDRVFEVLPGARVSLSGLQIQHGQAGAASGGGIAISRTGVLTLTNSAVISNAAGSGGGIWLKGRLAATQTDISHNQGGGIQNAGGSLSLHDARIVSNTLGYGITNEGALTFEGGALSGNAGGGLFNSALWASLADVSVIGNTTGGGIYNMGAGPSPASLSIVRSQVLSNTGSNGAGIFNSGVNVSADILDTFIAYNTASVNGGGVFNNAIMTVQRSTLYHNSARAGGGVHHNGGSLHLTNATLGSNFAQDNGGGIYNKVGVFLTNLTIAHNSANGNGGAIFNDEASSYPKNTIFFANTSIDGNCSNSPFASQVSQGYNLDDDDTCSLTATGDITHSNPLLGPLQDNGGATPTQALLPGSPAIDGGTNSGCPATDQRGLPRPQGIRCDMGSYELGDIPGGYTLTLAYAGGGSGTVGKNPDRATYLPGTVVTLTAIPYAGSSFAGWSGAAIGTANPISVTMDADKSITATFTVAQPPVADAGQSQIVKSRTLVTLDGSGSYDPDDNLPLSYGWLQDGGEPVILDSPVISRPIFTAPGVVTQSQTLTFTLVVTDALGLASAPAQALVVVVPHQSFLPIVMLDSGNIPQGVLSGGKYYDASANGQYDDGEVWLSGWRISYGGLQVATDLDGQFSVAGAPGVYVFTEVAGWNDGASGWFQTGNTVAQTVATGGAAVTLSDLQYAVHVPNDTPSSASGLYFGNVCKWAPGGRTPGFWHNRNGQAIITVDDLAALRDLNLVNEDGSPFDPTATEQVAVWILAVAGQNMAYKLSSFVAVDTLNIRHGLTDPGVSAEGQTAPYWLDHANALLGQDGDTPPGDEPMRSQQESAKNILDQVANGLSFIQPDGARCGAAYR